MMKKRKNAGLRTSPGGVLLFGVILSAGVFLLLSLLMAAIADATGDPTSKIPLFSLAAYLLAAGISGFLISARRTENGFLYAMLTALLFSLLLMLIGILMSGGKLAVKSLMNDLCYLLVSMLAALMGRRKKPKRHRR